MTQNSNNLGLDVAVYKIDKNLKDIDSIILDLKDESLSAKDIKEVSLSGKALIGQNKGIKLIYSSDGAKALSMDTAEHGFYPSSLKDNSDFAYLKKFVREDFILHYKGQILVPSGYFVLNIKKADDWVKFYINSNDSDDPRLNGNCTFVEKRSSQLAGIFTKDFCGEIWPTGNYRITYFAQSEFIDIDIFVIQKKGDFSFEIDALMGLTLEDILIKSGKDSLSDLTMDDVKIRTYEKIGSMKPFHDYSNYFYPPDYSENPDSINEEEHVRNIFEPDNAQNGFKAQITKTLDIGTYFDKDRDKRYHETFKRPQEWIPRSTSDPYWDRPCPDCPFDTYAVSAINQALINFSNEEYLPLNTYGRDNTESNFSEKVFSTNLYGNYSLKFDTKNYASACQRLSIFELFKNAFDFIKSNSKDVLTSRMQESDERLSMLLGKETENKDKTHDGFKDYFLNNIYSSVIRFSGEIELPNGILAAKLNDFSGLVVIFINRKNDLPIDSTSLEKNSFIRGYENSSKLSKLKNIYRGKPFEKVKVEVLVYHFSGHLELDLDFAVDEKGENFEDLGEILKNN